MLKNLFISLFAKAESFKKVNKIYGLIKMNEKNTGEIKLGKTDHAKELMEEIEITDEEVKDVINNAETTGEKLYDDNGNFLGKFKIENRTIYVKYHPKEAGTFDVYSAYAAKAEIKPLD